MATAVTERMESREVTTGDDAYAIRRYVITGTADDTAAKAAMTSFAPTIHGALVRRKRHVWPIFIDSNNEAVCIWEGEVRYGTRQLSPDTGDSVYSFDTAGGTQHITQSLESGRFPATAFDYQGAIGAKANAQGEVTIEGVDIAIPIFSWTETHYLSSDFVTPAYKADLFALTGKICDRTWRGFARGEVLFVGAGGSKRSSEDWELNYQFKASPNISGVTIGAITGIHKGGWDYLWVTYRDAVDTEIGKRPKAVYIDRVYEYADLSLLGLGI